MGWRGLLLITLAGCSAEFPTERLDELPPPFGSGPPAMEPEDAGLRDGEMTASEVQAHCHHWLCEGLDAGTTVHRGCGGLDAYHCH